MSKEKIIVALDVSTAKEALEIVTELRDAVGAFKIGLQLFTSAGASFVRDLTASGVKIFLDLKFHDIPNTTAKASVEAARLGVWMFNMHASGGSEMMRRAVAEVGEICVKENLPRPLLIGVTVLTGTDESILDEVGIEQSAARQVEKLALLAARSGMDGVVASAHEVDLIRRAVGDEKFLVVTPGIRPSFATTDDQKRVMTPREAVRAGTDYMVIGRPILRAENRLAAVEKILEEIREDESAN